MQQALFNENTARILHEEQILSVSELSTLIKGTLEKNFLDLKIQGEISGLKKHSSGHTYFSLKDQDSVINAICWRGTHLALPLEEGLQIIAKGRVTSYPARSQYQFIVEAASVAGEGALLKLLNDRKKKFQEMGYFSKKRALPKYPQIIGIVTSKTGAVFHDMQHRLKDRYPFCLARVWSVNVQGGQAAEQVAKAVRGFNLMSDTRPDVLIVARGGGSIEDLWPFNEEIVVKAVFESAIPVISAIGHETDTTLIDYAADLRAPTPTAAIELCTPVLSEVIASLSLQDSLLKKGVIRLLNEKQAKVSIATKSLEARKFSLMGLFQRFDELVDSFTRSFKFFFEVQNLRLQKQRFANLDNYLNLKEQSYKILKECLQRISRNYLERWKDKIENLTTRLEQSSYKKILEKGFCFITDSFEESVKTAVEFSQKKEQGLTIHFFDGSAKI